MNQKKITIPSIEHNISLLPFNTFAIDCLAKDFCVLDNQQQVALLVDEWLLTEETKLLVLGWGSNILLSNQQFDGLVIKNNILGKTIQTQTDTTITLKVWAGENRDAFVRWTIEQWYCGIENLISIPWSVWAAPMQNIWAYGVEVWTRISEVEAVHIGSGEKRTLSKEACDFWYRDSIFKHALKWKVIITSVTFILEKYSPDNYEPVISYWAIKDRIEWKTLDPALVAKTIAAIRASKLPDWTKIGTAWSFFKNPILSTDEANEITIRHPDLVTYDAGPWLKKFSAWQLIDLSWLKGITQWAVGTYDNHALVLVNHGWWTGQELLALSKHIQQTVQENFWVLIEPEVNII